MVAKVPELRITLWSDTQQTADALLARIYALDPEAQVTALQGKVQFFLRLSREDNALVSRLASPTSPPVISSPSAPSSVPGCAAASTKLAGWAF